MGGRRGHRVPCAVLRAMTRELHERLVDLVGR